MANPPTRALNRSPDAILYTWHAEARASELDVVVEQSRVRYREGAEDGPPVEIIRGRDLLERPGSHPGDGTTMEIRVPLEV